MRGPWVPLSTHGLAFKISVRWEYETQNAALAAGLGGGSYTEL